MTSPAKVDRKSVVLRFSFQATIARGIKYRGKRLKPNPTLKSRYPVETMDIASRRINTLRECVFDMAAHTFFSYYGTLRVNYSTDKAELGTISEKW